MQREENNMEEYGKLMQKHGVSHIYFVHGTFVGTSPLGFLERIPDFGIKKYLGEIVKVKIDSTVGDLGNYTESYIELFKKSIGVDITCSRFNWGSGNYHSARVIGSLKLVKEIANNMTGSTEQERILLMGHSHAGQLFALLTTFIEDEEILKLDTRGEMSMLEKLVNEIGLNEVYGDISQLKVDIKKFDKIFFDIVTFGTPPRYHWGKLRQGGNPKYRLLNIVNHHRKDKMDVTIDGILNTRDGDYVQQWGIGKTDLYDRHNDEIEEIIGQEQYNFSLPMLFIGKRHMPKYGETVLIDYGEKGKTPQDSFLGHGAYTRTENMPLNTKLIVEKYYVV